MIIGIPQEVKIHEYRVGATPALVRLLVSRGHRVCVQANAGAKVGFTDAAYRAAGATVVATAKEAYQADMIVKVKELQPSEFSLLHPDQIVFCFLHLAPDPKQTKHLIESGVIAIAYETVTDSKGRLPLLAPMSEIAGRISIQVGAAALQMDHGGSGVLLSGVPGVPPGKVMVIGGGNVGVEAARAALGVGCNVVLLDRDLTRLKELDMLFGPRLQTVYSTPTSIEEYVANADLVVGAVLIPGKTAPHIVTKEMIKRMKPGSVVVDVAIDQGGCMETSRPTTHASPTYVVDGVVHYCVTNMPGICAKTATLALTNATMNYVVEIADKGVVKALQENPHLRNGLNVCQGKITNEAVASDLGYSYVPAEEALLHIKTS